MRVSTLILSKGITFSYAWLAVVVMQGRYAGLTLSNHIHMEKIDQKMIFNDSDETEIKSSFLQIFLIILEYIWWSLHSSFLFMDMGKR